MFKNHEKIMGRENSRKTPRENHRKVDYQQLQRKTKMETTTLSNAEVFCNIVAIRNVEKG